jgi:hypothetical protein
LPAGRPRFEDEDLIAEPLAAPGRVIKRLRGTEEEQFAALAPDKPRTKPTKGEGRATPKSGRRAHCGPPLIHVLIMF